MPQSNAFFIRTTLVLALIMALRMLGIFMLLPLLAVYAKSLEHATAMTLGLAFGIYGLTQAGLQMPFGLLSDRVGRKKIILLGFVLFILGSLLCAFGHSIIDLIIGRALQGTGAVGSVILALVADCTREEERGKAMALLGMTIGAAFALSLILGPLSYAWLGMRGVFLLTAMLASIAIVLLFFAVPNVKNVFHRDSEPVPALLMKTLKHPQLWHLNGGILLLHLILTTTFIAVPLILTQSLHFPDAHQWKLYLSALITAVISMIPLLILFERKAWAKEVMLIAIGMLFVSEFFFLPATQTLIMVWIGLWLFLTAFTLLEAMLPALISSAAPSDAKGTALGIYSTSQFLGIFLGGSLGGVLLHHYHLRGILLYSMVAALLWFLMAMRMQQPARYSSILLKLGDLDAGTAAKRTQELLNYPGVVEATVIRDEGMAYVKIDRDKTNANSLRQCFMSQARS